MLSQVAFDSYYLRETHKYKKHVIPAKAGIYTTGFPLAWE
jgi:hypothetical protein